MKTTFLLIFFLFQIIYLEAQLINNGGTVTNQSGAYILCKGNLTNASGTINNDGKIEVQGNFSNSGTYISTFNTDTLVMSGSGNTTLNTGGATLHYLSINKTTNSNVVTLASTVLVNKKLEYLSGTLSTDFLSNPSFVLSAPASAIFDFTAGREIIGNVKRTDWFNGATVPFNSAFTQLTTSGGTAPSEMMATMLPQAFGGDPSQAEKEVKRKYLFTPSGGADFITDIQFPYLTSELNINAEGNLVPWHLASSEWNAVLSPVTNNVIDHCITTSGVDITTLRQEWKLADPKYTFNVSAFLRGAWNSGSLDMNTTLNTAGEIPLSQPYNISPFNYAGSESVATIPNSNIVDWVLVDFRKTSDGLPASATAAAIIGQKAAFLLKDGSIVDFDGVTPLQMSITKQGAGFFVLRHRNHLAVISNSLPSNAQGSYANDFSLFSGAYINPTLTNTPVQTLPNSTKFGLWAGNANKDAVMNASDIALVKSQANAALSGYQIGDVNLDATVNASDIGLTKFSSNGAASSHLLRTTSTTIKSSHVPVD